MVTAWLAVIGSSPGIATAMHEIDHRFTVEGTVCGADGRPVSGTKVIVRDPRASVGTAEFTDGRGYYKAVLHLHNQNQGDPVLVEALNQEQRGIVQLDPKDVKTERKITINIGSGCEGFEGDLPDWVLYGGIGLAAVAIFAGARWMKRRQRAPQKHGKGQRK
jgi:hypothetical protein